MYVKLESTNKQLLKEINSLLNIELIEDKKYDLIIFDLDTIESKIIDTFLNSMSNFPYLIINNSEKEYNHSNLKSLQMINLDWIKNDSLFSWKIEQNVKQYQNKKNELNKFLINNFKKWQKTDFLNAQDDQNLRDNLAWLKSSDSMLDYSKYMNILKHKGFANKLNKNLDNTINKINNLIKKID